MQKKIIRFSPVALACTTFLIAGLPAAAETLSFKVDLKASNEVPPNDSKASGSATVSYETASKNVSWKGSYSGLSGPVTAAHFHGPADAGKNAGITLPIVPNTSPFEGSATLNDAQAADLMGGRWYINIHTAAQPAGEIRGQVVK